MTQIKVLFITTSNDKIGETSGKTGVWLEELAAPYYFFKDAEVHVTLASPMGDAVPLDPKSLSIIVANRTTKRFLKDPDAMSFLSHSVLLEKISSTDFDMVFLPGGLGCMWDMIKNNILKEILESFVRENKVVAAICHGVAGLISVENLNGGPFVEGKNLTCFSNAEEESRGLTHVLPFALESQLQLMGANYTKGRNYVCHVVADGNLITGQNPDSSEEVARQALALAHHNARLSKYDIPVFPDYKN